MADEWTKGVGKRSIFDVSDWMGADELGGGPMYSAVEHFGSEYGTGEGKSGVSHPLHVPPTDFAYTLIDSAAAQGAPMSEVVHAWNMYKKNQYQFRSPHDFQQPLGRQSGEVERVGPSSDSYLYSTGYEDSGSIPTHDRRAMNEAIIAEAKAMEAQGGAEGVPLTPPPDVGNASVVQRPKFRGNY